MKRAIGREKFVGAEKHHIVPKCIGGKEVVNLTYREHYLAHWLLTKFTTGSLNWKMDLALMKMGQATSRNKRSIPSRYYERSRKAAADWAASLEYKANQSKIHKGRKQDAEWIERAAAPKRGRKHSPETCAKKSAALKGRVPGHRIPHTIEAKKKIGDAHRGNTYALGKKQSAEHIAKRIRPAGWKHSAETRAKMRATKETEALPMTANLATKQQAKRPSIESLYRTRWLIAHNRLHSLVHRQEPPDDSELKHCWQEYLDELNASEEIASRLA